MLLDRRAINFSSDGEWNKKLKDMIGFAKLYNSTNKWQ